MGLNLFWPVYLEIPFGLNGLIKIQNFWLSACLIFHCDQLLSTNCCFISFLKTRNFLMPNEKFFWVHTTCFVSNVRNFLESTQGLWTIEGLFKDLLRTGIIQTLSKHYNIVSLFCVACAAPNKGTTVLSQFISLSNVISPIENSKIKVFFNALTWF